MTDLDLSARAAELEAMGFTILEQDEHHVDAVRSKWMWECLATKMTTIVRVRRVGLVTRKLMLEDQKYIAKNASSLDPSMLPGGFQKGRSVMFAYLADEAAPEALQLAQKPPTMDFAAFNMFAILEASGQQTWYQGTRLWGAVYYAKFQHFMRNLMEPGRHAPGDPLSMPGLIISLLLGGMLGGICCGMPALLFLAEAM